MRWAPSCRRILTERKIDATGWFIIGVAIGFMGGAMDNLWWGLAWSQAYLSDSTEVWLFVNGVFSNIPFRQIAGIAAAYCHIRSKLAYSSDGSPVDQVGRLNTRLLFWMCLGCVYVTGLWIYKV